MTMSETLIESVQARLWDLSTQAELEFFEIDWEIWR